MVRRLLASEVRGVFVVRPDDEAVGAKTSVGVVDAQPLFRAGVVQVLRAHGRMSVVAEGETAVDALQIASSLPLDVLLLDLDIAGGGMQALANLSRTWPAIKLVVLTASEREEDVSNALSCGARGYLLKHIKENEFIAALKAIASGEVYLTPSLGAKLFARSAVSSANPAEAPAVPVLPSEELTARENEILAEVAIGATNKEIARTLNIAEKTVKHYMTSIMQKLHVRNRVEAVVLMRDRMRKSA